MRYYFDNEEDDKNDFNNKLDELNEDPYFVEDDELKTVFSSQKDIGIEKKIIDEDEEKIPQDNENYEIKSQIIEEETKNLKLINVSKEMRSSFLEYAMSVIVSRALPDAKDGLKPVHRRILYGMSELGITSNVAHKKSARIVGDVLGKYHPHGDSSVYDAMVRMAQEFSLRYPLIDGHGNFGSIDGDEAAAMRYTEARLSKIATTMVEGIKKDTVNFTDNYDASEREPVVLPARIPNLLISGATGIAIGMATNIPPHNLTEVINGVVALAKDPDLTILDLMQYIKGPDFPTGAEILGIKGINDAYQTGKGSITIRSKSHIEVLKNGKSRIIITEIPYEVKKPKTLEKIAELVKNKKIEGISDLRDETSHKGIRIVIEIKKNHIPEIVWNKLLKHTNFQTNFSANMIAIVNGEPKRLNIKQALVVYLKHQKNVVRRRTEFDLKKAKAKAHVLEGLKISIQNINDVIKIIKLSKNDSEAQEKLRDTFNLSEIQSKAITDMRLGRLTGLAIEKMEDELVELKTTISDLNEILNSKDKLINLIIQELEEIKVKFGDDRRTKINLTSISNISDEDLIPITSVAITMSKKGYVKRIPLTEYRTQRRGGFGSNTINTYEDDDVDTIICTTTHTDLLIFSSYGKIYRTRVHQVPEMSKISKGIPFINIVGIQKGEKIVSLLTINEYFEGTYLMTITKKGIVKKTYIGAYHRINTNGKIALGIKDGDELVKAMLVNDTDNIIIGSSKGKVIHFEAKTIRASGRISTGVIGMRLEPKGDFVVGAGKSSDGTYILSIGAKGFGKKTHLDEHRIIHRGGKGVKSIEVKKSGNLNFVGIVQGTEDIILITNDGVAIRTDLANVSQTSRATKGVKIINLRTGDSLKSVAVINQKQIEEEITKTLELEINANVKEALENEEN